MKRARACVIQEETRRQSLRSREEPLYSLFTLLGTPLLFSSFPFLVFLVVAGLVPAEIRHKIDHLVLLLRPGLRAQSGFQR